MDKQRENSIIFDTFLQRLMYNSSNYHIVLYSIPHGFEYDIDTLKIRPLNSILWYKLEKNSKYSQALEYLNLYCINKMEDFDKDIEAPQTNSTKYYNGHLSIDIDKLSKNLRKDRSIKSNNTLLDSFRCLKCYIDGLYVMNDELLRSIIRLQENLL